MELMSYAYGILKGSFSNTATVNLTYKTKRTIYGKNKGNKLDTALTVTNIGSKKAFGFEIGRGSYRVLSEIRVDIESSNFDEAEYIRRTMYRLFDQVSKQYRACHHTYVPIAQTDITNIDNQTVFIYELTMAEGHDVEVGQARSITIDEDTITGIVISNNSNKYYLYTAKIDFSFININPYIDLSGLKEHYIYSIQVPITADTWYFRGDEEW